MIVCLFALAVLGGLGALAILSDEPKSSRQAGVAVSTGYAEGAPIGDVSSLNVIPRLQGRQRANFAVLRTPAEGLPGEVKEILRRPVYGMNWGLAQRLRVKLVERQIWAVPGNGFLCLVDRQGEAVGTICDRTKRTLRRGLFTAYLSGTDAISPRLQRFIVGIASDNARAVVAYTGGSAVRIPVVRGVFLQRDEAESSPDRLVVIEKRAPG